MDPLWNVREKDGETVGCWIVLLIMNVASVVTIGSVFVVSSGSNRCMLNLACQCGLLKK